MARNEEKSHSMLNRYLQMKRDESQGPRDKRPPLASMETSLVKAEKWRMQLLREIGKAVSDIQNGWYPSLALKPATRSATGRAGCLTRGIDVVV